MMMLSAVSLTADGDRIGAVGSASMDSRVPSCPDWDVADLMTHVGWVHRPRFFNHVDFGRRGRTIRLDGTDGDAWVITVRADTTEWRRCEEIAVDMTVRGGLSDLYLFFWERPSADPLDVVGDARLLARWQATVAF